MLDIHKGAAVTAVVLFLAVWCMRLLTPGLVFPGLLVIAFLLPILLPNGRWVMGCAAFFAAGFAISVASASDGLDDLFALLSLFWVCVALVVGVAARYVLRAPEPKLPPIALRSMAWTACAAAVALAICSLSVMLSAKASAEEIASGRPYCIQVESSDYGYRSVGSVFDLAGFYMMSNGVPNHAVLVVRDSDKFELHHWSYWKNRFESGVNGEPPIYCEPGPDFLRHPRRLRYAFANRLNFVMRGCRFSIPYSYSPRASSTGPTIAIAAAPMRFGPGNNYLPREIPSNHLSITVGTDANLQFWRKKQSADYRVESLGEENGLIKERIRFRDSKSYEFQYYELQPDGDVKTLVLCFDGDRHQCAHLFSDGKFSYSFHHMPRDLRDWRRIQQALVSTVSGFVVPEAPAP
jgi:hypothetical protein